ncbi:DUF2806 domain-containing protein [Acidiphilium sp. PA]|uniref:DUF2806 domain-containing protein n=1 Tax=Acidiphilium sp. PA TaxID=2871705 RepID=UPI00224355F5|nr:DUF2806 domain-containing protein [Acidiphilium sp. PA]MCW8308104.1 DUF2806 domain-containing protein [Acidiphilium sp. PA]
MDLNALIQSFSGTTGAIAAWHAVPSGVKSRVAQGYDRLTGRLTRKWDVADQKENAGLADDAKRKSNKTDAQEAVLQLLVPDFAKKISCDPDRLERALIETMGEAYRNQENKDAVAEECLKDVAAKSQDYAVNDDLLDEDWLNLFSSYAEKASSERTRQLWGRILSGQVRRPGSFGLSTLRCLSEIDQNIARLFIKITPLVSDSAIFIAAKEKDKRFSEFLELEQAGLLAGVEANLCVKIPVSDSNIGEWSDDQFFLRIESHSTTPIEVPCIVLTKAGRELLTIVDRTGTHGDRLNFMYNAIPRRDIKSFSIHLIMSRLAAGIRYAGIPLKKWPEDINS